jgi:hypothetical protein
MFQQIGGQLDDLITLFLCMCGVLIGIIVLRNPLSSPKRKKIWAIIITLLAVVIIGTISQMISKM